jgi:hypothetical protein
MKRSNQLIMIAIAILIVFGIIDMLPFTPVTAIGMIFIILFKPIWFRNFINSLYE